MVFGAFDAKRLTECQVFHFHVIDIIIIIGWQAIRPTGKQHIWRDPKLLCWDQSLQKLTCIRIASEHLSVLQM